MSKDRNRCVAWVDCPDGIFPCSKVAGASGYCVDHEPHPPRDVISPRGRPPRVPGEASEVRVIFRVTREQKALLQWLSEQAGQTVSSTIRAALMVGLEALGAVE